MNQPIRKIRQENGATVYLLNGKETKLERGFNTTQVYRGSTTDSATGEIKQHFAPNRRERRSFLQKATRRQELGLYGKQLSDIQTIKNSFGNVIKTIFHPVPRKVKF
jgi:hypothetical protein